MNYLYGDSTTSQLKSNFLEFLRDALDFCVFVLQADARMKEGRVQIRVLGEEAEQESQRLERFINAVQGTVITAQKGAANSPTAMTAARLTQQIADTHRQSIEGIRRMLAENIARIEAEENATRDACVNALALLIAPHDPPDTAGVTRLGLLESGHYDATLDGRAEPALEWTLELGIPDGHPWAAPMRVERIMPLLEIRAPQLAGWITKEVKIKPIRIERYVVTEIVESDSALTFELRTEATSDLGFDFHVDFANDKVKATRIGPADDQSSGDFELDPDLDVVQIRDLALKLKDSLAGLERIPNIVATFEGADFRTLPEYIEIVDRLVTMMAPIVREISARSLTPNELVLRRLLGNDRREEIFVAKVTLREKLKDLPPATRALFDPLQLDPALPQKASAPNPAAPPPPAPTPTAPVAVTTKEEKPPVRSELPPSVPPPPMRAAPPAIKIPAPPSIKGLSVPTVPKSTPPAKKESEKPPTPSGTMTAVKPTRTIMPTGPAVPPPAQLSTSPAEPAVDPDPEREREPEEEEWSSPSDAPDEAPSLEVGPEVEMPADLFEPVPESSNPLATKSDGPRNEPLVGALKKIMTLSKNGRGGEAYQEYANLFSSDSFGAYKADDQRQALKLMVLAKNHPADKDAVVAAHEAALPRIQALLDTEKTAADLELLGVTKLHLGDSDAAAQAFQAGLDMERSRNPQSDLIASLMRRVSQL